MTVHAGDKEYLRNTLIEPMPTATTAGVAGAGAHAASGASTARKIGEEVLKWQASQGCHRIPNPRNHDEFEKKLGEKPCQQQLENLPGWKWTARRSSWEFMVEAVSKWTRTHQGEGEGVNVRYPSQYSKDKDEKKLAIWVYTQRMNYHGKRGHARNESRREMLENLPGWKWIATSVKESNS